MRRQRNSARAFGGREALLVFLVLISGLASAESGAEVLPALFSEAVGEIPDSWVPLDFPKISSHTRYAMMRESDDSDWVLSAVSRSSASGLRHEVDVDLARFPILRWRWKVENVMARGDAREKRGDDYAARVYLVFDVRPEDLSFWERTRYRAARLLYGEIPGRAINYVWANKVEKGAVLDSAYVGSFAKLVAVESGTDHVGEWRTEERDVYRDYVAFYGKAPPPVNGIAIMTDSDDTQGEATAYYGDIEFLRRPVRDLSPEDQASPR